MDHFTKTNEELLSIHRKLIEQNNITEGLVYLQISRGKAERDFAFPISEVEPTIVLFTQQKKIINNQKLLSGAKVISCPDLRWGRADIKTVQLLYASMMKQKALDIGKDDVWFVKNNFITEGSSNNTFILSIMFAYYLFEVEKRHDEPNTVVTRCTWRMEAPSILGVSCS